MDHLVAPRTSGHLNAQLSLDEVRRTAGLNSTLDLAHGPRVLMADVTASMDQQNIQIQSARLTLGKANLEASGDLKQGSGAKFNASFDLGELGGMLRISARPTGLLKLGGALRLDAQNNYDFAGNMEARQVAFSQGTIRISNVSLDSAVTANRRRIALADLRLGALGGRFVGAASLEEMAAFILDGRLQNFDVETVARTFMHRGLGYNGVVSGPIAANGNVKNPADLLARANLTIAPMAAHAKAYIPVSGRLYGDYNGHADTVTFGASYVALPHTRLDFSGQLGRQIQVRASFEKLC